MKFEIGKNNDTIKQIAEAYKSGDAKAIGEAWNAYNEEVQQSIKKQFDEFMNNFDNKVAVARGCRVLNSAELKFYNDWIETAKSSNPKQAFADLITKEGMPETIYETIYENIIQESQLLKHVRFEDVKFLTKWIMTKPGKERAIWGEINSAITKQIEGNFELLEIVQNKLTAFLILPKDMLDLGPVWLDSYVRKLIVQAIILGLEYGVVCGKGVKGEPTGLTRNCKKDVEFSQTEGYPLKEKIVVTDFTPKTYGALIADNLLKDEDGNIKVLSSVQLLCNPIDYFRKIMPATTVMNTDGSYTKDIFPFKTDVIQSIFVDENSAILANLPNYFLGVGHSKNAQIEYTDDVKFFEDQRAYKAKLYADGKPMDNTVSVVLDITNLDPAYITVLAKQLTQPTTEDTAKKEEEESTPQV